MTKNNKFCEVVQQDAEYLYCCRVYHTSEAHFSLPCDSRLVGITKFHHQSYEITILKHEDLIYKCMKVKETRHVIFYHFFMKIKVSICYLFYNPIHNMLIWFWWNITDFTYTCTFNCNSFTYSQSLRTCTIQEHR